MVNVQRSVVSYTVLCLLLQNLYHQSSFLVDCKSNNFFVDYFSNLSFEIIDILEGLLGSILGQYIPLPDQNKSYLDQDDSDQDIPDPDKNDFDPGKDIPDPGEDGSDPGKDSPDPGEGGSGPGKDDPDDKSPYKGKGKARAISPESFEKDEEYSGKGKGKARAITPELPEEPNTELDENLEDENLDDFEKARLNSLEDQFKQESKQGESSKQGASLAYEEYLAEQARQSKLEEFHTLNKARIEATRLFNDTLDKIDREGDSMDPRDKEFLINETIRLREDITKISSHVENLKSELDIDSEEFDYDKDNSGDN